MCTIQNQELFQQGKVGHENDRMAYKTEIDWGLLRMD